MRIVSSPADLADVRNRSLVMVTVIRHCSRRERGQEGSGD
jgi:hypothetical protein